MTIAVVIPSYRVTQHILGVLGRIGTLCQRIYVVDDCCPDESGKYVQAHCTDPRVRVLRTPTNMGVGGAVMEGYRAAIQEGATIIVKIDGDGQMAPELLPEFVAPILAGSADYTKGNRFYDLTNISRMPKVRLFGNAALSFLSKFSGGYWDIFDPTNGYTAIHARTASHLPFDKISNRYFFETDMLFRLNSIRAVVVDVPMDAEYGDEKSNLKIKQVLGEFLLKHTQNFCKRIFYNYFLRDLSAASIELVFGLLLTLSGGAFGIAHWVHSWHSGIATTTGTVMLAALPVLLGFQLLLAFVVSDIQSVPRLIVHPRLRLSLRNLAPTPVTRQSTTDAP
ncbi:glycosyltransferase family 2 protein [Rhodanobacter umsongensis]